ncbi:hypothetical protein BU25DRAFT_179715 [Macroventuria anomochaeta]|uniref:Uncharacterized protein n=1 Tax=Macroventuria anomochaeta TaxID=301207 RepID=A0ACB6RQC6_9PLEO|nr:uncharacterized protein BU25DRAFT_179715 [Macroventuria anomochaeta]KAF2623472.1 hypothetical protein BU25DRAFT_179715 [Macroventuria anomochaeta]
MAPRETTYGIVVDANPPAYPGGIVEVHHHHHHTLCARNARYSAFCRILLVVILVFFIIASFGIVTFVAWNFHEVAECEKHRLPWEKPCKDWLGKDLKDWLGRSSFV